MDILRGFISRVLFLILSLLHLTLRYRFIVDEDFEKIRKDKNAYLLAIWHQVLIPGILVQQGREFVVMISRSKDADPVAYLCNKLKYVVYRGSSSKNGKDKGGQNALTKMINKVKEGVPGSMTVDGPTGPAKIAKKGIVKLSLETNVPIVPYYAAIESYWQFNSWDKFRFPKPFSKVIISYGRPLDITNVPIEEAIDIVTKNINQIEVTGTQSFSNWQNLKISDC